MWNANERRDDDIVSLLVLNIFCRKCGILVCQPSLHHLRTDAVDLQQLLYPSPAIDHIPAVDAYSSRPPCKTLVNNCHICSTFDIYSEHDMNDELWIWSLDGIKWFIESIFVFRTTFTYDFWQMRHSKFNTLPLISGVWTLMWSFSRSTSWNLSAEMVCISGRRDEDRHLNLYSRLMAQPTLVETFDQGQMCGNVMQTNFFFERKPFAAFFACVRKSIGVCDALMCSQIGFECKTWATIFALENSSVFLQYR